MGLTDCILAREVHAVTTDFLGSVLDRSQSQERFVRRLRRQWRPLGRARIETCKLDAVDPQDYLDDVISRIANGHPNSRLDDSKVCIEVPAFRAGVLNIRPFLCLAQNEGDLLLRKLGPLHRQILSVANRPNLLGFAHSKRSSFPGSRSPSLNHVDHSCVQVLHMNPDKRNVARCA